MTLLKPSTRMCQIATTNSLRQGRRLQQRCCRKLDDQNSGKFPPRRQSEGKPSFPTAAIAAHARPTAVIRLPVTVATRHARIRAGLQFGPTRSIRFLSSGYAFSIIVSAKDAKNFAASFFAVLWIRRLPNWASFPVISAFAS